MFLSRVLTASVSKQSVPLIVWTDLEDWSDLDKIVKDISASLGGNSENVTFYIHPYPQVGLNILDIRAISRDVLHMERKTGDIQANHVIINHNRNSPHNIYLKVAFYQRLNINYKFRNIFQFKLFGLDK
jgi:hypothetical protein